MTLLSIVVPVYNTNFPFLSECIASVEQLMEKREDIELIVCDDGSNIQTIMELKSLQKKYCNFQLLSDGKNRGQNGARNIGVKKATGKYILFLDSDDYLNTKDLDKCLKQLEYVDSDVVSFTTLINDDSDIAMNSLISKQEFISKKDVILQCGELWKFIFKRTLLTNAPLLEGIKIGEDVVSAIVLIAKASGVYSFKLEPYIYRKNQLSIMSNANVAQRYHILDGFSWIKETLDKDLFDEFYPEIEWQAIKHILIYESQQILKSGLHYRYYVKKMRWWMNKNFPRWKSNIYLKKYDCGLRTKLIVRGYFTLFYCVDRLLGALDDSE